VPILGKMAGAVGNYNAHMSAYPDVDWQDVAETFVTGEVARTAWSGLYLGTVPRLGSKGFGVFWPMSRLAPSVGARFTRAM
jgi:hypothetical protein